MAFVRQSRVLLKIDGIIIGAFQERIIYQGT